MPNQGDIATDTDTRQSVLDTRSPLECYVRTQDGYEVDFMARYYDRREDLIQVCVNPAEPTVLAREFRSLESVAIEYPKATKRLLILTRDVLPSKAAPNIVMQPAYEWLLG